MVYIEPIIFIVAAAIVFITINVLTPMLYDVWFNNLAPSVKDTTLHNAGNNFFNSWMIMGYLVPGVLIAWGFAVAARKRSREDQVEY